MERQEVMHGRISHQMPCAETSNEGVYLPSPLHTERSLEVSQHRGSIETSKKGDPPPAQMLSGYVSYTPFHQQGQQRPIDSSHAHPFLDLSLERPDMCGTRHPQKYQEYPVPLPLLSRGTFDAQTSDMHNPLDARPHGSSSSHTFDLEQQPFQHAEQPNPGSCNVNPGKYIVNSDDVQGNAYLVQQAGYHVQRQTYHSQTGTEPEDGLGTYQEAYQTHAAVESRAQMSSAPQDDGSLEQAGDGKELQLVPLSGHPNGGHDQQIYPHASATHDAVVQDSQLFMATLENFHAGLGSRLTVPKLDGLELNLHAFYCEVTARGGFVQVVRSAQWKELSERLGILQFSFSTPYVLRKHYSSLLFHYEQVYYFRAEGHLVTPPVPLPAPSAVEPVAEVESPYEVPAELIPSLKKRKRKLDPLQVFGVDPAASIGAVVTGAINGKTEEGYYVTVVVGTERLSGVLYHFSADLDNQQFAKVPSLLEGIGSEVNTAGLEVQLYVKQRKDRIKTKDPNAPKRTRTGYNIYFKEQCEKLKQLHPDIKGLGKKVIEMWGKLPENEKSLYNARGSEERERYMTEYREKMKLQPQVVETAGDFGTCEQPVSKQDHDAYYVSHDYHVSLEPESDLQSEQNPQLCADTDQVYHAHHANGPQSHCLPDAEMPIDRLISEQAYEMQEDEGDYNQEPGSDEDGDDAEAEEDGDDAEAEEAAYEGEENETVYRPSEKGYEEHDGTDYPQAAKKSYSTQEEGVCAFSQNEAMVQKPRSPDISLTSRQPYYGQDQAFMYTPNLPQQRIQSEGTPTVKSMGQLPYQMQNNGNVVYSHGHTEASGDGRISQHHYLHQGGNAYANPKGGEEVIGLPMGQKHAGFHRQEETAAYPAPFHHHNRAAMTGIQTRPVPREQMYQDRYAYPMHFPHPQMYARPLSHGYPVRFPPSPYPMPWSDSHAPQFGHMYAPQIHQPQASVPEVLGGASSSQVYQGRDAGHSYQA